MDDKIYNLCIIGGGINGCGIARHATGSGLSVFLCEKGDFASGTSSTSTKLIHGGLRYLEYYDFPLVFQSLQERERLLKLAPHIIWPMKFILPDDPEKRPSWKVKAGLFAYDVLGGFKQNRRSQTITLAENETGKLLNSNYENGFSYYDCWGQDSRLVILNAMDAYANGAELHTWTECVRATPHEGLWLIIIRNIVTGYEHEIKANMIVNAAGPWAEHVINNCFEMQSDTKLTLVKGSHLVLNHKMPDQDTGLLLQAENNRVIFILPYQQHYTLVGTTEEIHTDIAETVAISDNEKHYLLEQVNHYLETPFTEGDIIDSYAGLRPLYDSESKDASAMTRDYVLKLEDSSGAPLLNVFGGKLTTFRKLSHKAMDLITPFFNKKNLDWTANTPLPGGDISTENWDEFYINCCEIYSFLPVDLVYRYARNYGTLIAKLIGNAQSLDDMGEDFGDMIFEAEIRYLVEYEWALTVDDIVTRRLMMTQQISATTQDNINQWLNNNLGTLTKKKHDSKTS